MSHTNAWKRKQRERAAQAAKEEFERSGLLPAGKEAPFFRLLGIGEERKLGGIIKNGEPNVIWVAPAYLVRLNRYMKRQGISSKLRTRTMRCYLEGKDPPEAVNDALAGYTEEQLLRNQP